MQNATLYDAVYIISCIKQRSENNPCLSVSLFFSAHYSGVISWSLHSNFMEFTENIHLVWQNIVFAFPLHKTNFG